MKNCWKEGELWERMENCERRNYSGEWRTVGEMELQKRQHVVGIDIEENESVCVKTNGE
jgi:hypothetical protein